MLRLEATRKEVDELLEIIDFQYKDCRDGVQRVFLDAARIQLRKAKYALDQAIESMDDVDTRQDALDLANPN